MGSHPSAYAPGEAQAHVERLAVLGQGEMGTVEHAEHHDAVRTRRSGSEDDVVTAGAPRPRLLRLLEVKSLNVEDSMADHWDMRTSPVHHAQLKDGTRVDVIPVRPATPRQRGTVLRRLCLLADGHSQHLLPIVGYCDGPAGMGIVSWPTSGTLQCMLDTTRGGLSDDTVVTVARHVAAGLFALHSTGLAHGRLQSSSIVVLSRDPLRVAIADLVGDEGSRGRDGASGSGTAAGCDDLEAVEPVAQQATKEADVQAFGRLVMEMLKGRKMHGSPTGSGPHMDTSGPPWSLGSECKSAVTGSSMEVRDKSDEEVPCTEAGSKLRQLCVRCVALDPKLRPSAATLAMELLAIQRDRLDGTSSSSASDGSGVKLFAGVGTGGCNATPPVRGGTGSSEAVGGAQGESLGPQAVAQSDDSRRPGSRMVVQWTAEDVRLWLCSHGVSGEVAECLMERGVDGKQLKRLYWAAGHGRRAVWAELGVGTNEGEVKAAASSVRAACQVLEEDGWLA